MTPRDRRVLLLGAAVVVGAVLGLRVFPAAVRTLLEERGSLAAERTLLEETEAALAQRSALEDSAIAMMAAVGGMDAQLLSGTSAAAALSNLNAWLARSPGLQHARLLTLTAVPDSSRAGPLRRLSAVIHLQTDFHGLAELLAALMQDDATLVVERMRVTAAEPVVPEPVVEQLEVEVLVTGWYEAVRRTGGRADRRAGGQADRRTGGPVDDLVRFASTHTPFRFSRRPASLRFGESPPPAPPPAAPKPVLLLTGILWGREPAAILEGMPGQEGAVVLRWGESVGALQVVRIERQRVLLSGFDTTWTLTVRQPWQ